LHDQVEPRHSLAGLVGHLNRERLAVEDVPVADRIDADRRLGEDEAE
jgi:hypothetical protein